MFNFTGRIGGLAYYIRIVVSTALLIAFEWLADSVTGDEGLIALAATLLMGIAILVWFFFAICVVRQRANDIGWHPLLLTALAFWTPLFLVLGFIPGKKESNKYGPPPSTVV